MVLKAQHKQVAALCLRPGTVGTEVLLITSRGTGRWIIPKGWPIEGKTDVEAALEEAWEEAGVTHARPDETPWGAFHYLKHQETEAPLLIKATVFRFHVSSLSDTYPEAKERQRAWFSQADAADQIQEPELQALIRAL